MRKLPVRLVSRDVNIVADVLGHGVMRRDDFIALGHFRSVGRCNFRLHQLMCAGILRRIDCVNGVAPKQCLYGLGSSARTLLVNALGVPTEEAQRLCRTDHSPTAIEHSLGILDFRVQLNLEAPRHQCDVAAWVAEIDCRHEFSIRSVTSSVWKRLVVKPDAYFQLNSFGEEFKAFLEIDLGNVALPRFHQKIRNFDSYARSGAFRDVYQSASFDVLTVTVGERRLASLAAIKPKYFNHLATTKRRLDEQGIFHAEWTSAEYGAGRLLDHLSFKVSEGTQ